VLTGKFLTPLHLLLEGFSEIRKSHEVESCDDNISCGVMSILRIYSN
jgi:hypothetical protein